MGATPATIGALLEASHDAINPRGKKSGKRSDNKLNKRDDRGKGKGKGKDRDGGN
jgi:hypothetical protein